jgi:hypothetical protein
MDYNMQNGLDSQCNMDMDMDMHDGYGIVPWTCTMDMEMYHGHGQAAWKRTCTKNRHGHAV